MKSPKQPNPYTTAAAQSAANRDTAITQQLLNMTNQVTPDGKLTYNQSGEAEITGENGQKYKVPTFTATTSLSPIQQQIYDQNNQADLRMNNIALGQIDRIGSHLSTPFQYDDSSHSAWASDLYGKLNDDANTKAREGLEQQLANRGVQVGSAAYDDAMRNLMYSQDKARNDFLLNSYGQGFQTAQAVRNQPINETTALMSGAQVQQPQIQQTPNVGVNGTDVAAIANNKYQAQLANYQANMGGLFNLASGVGQGLFMLSDKRAKQNISEVGKLNDGTKLYRYEYKPEVGGKRGLFHIGVMAGEAEKKHPDAVVTGADGLKRVDYGRIAEALA